ncbi:MAG: hypothetical protein DMD30_06520 [Gemmatimonadetes bacterium]|nr:MAG: hypothetical protein DMD30_06520 [Gemmatimonadota bacterium]PYP53132.1 MAG: hypothetical protein DMD39_05605 [Gemmatimonadota bacterium]
MSRAPVARDPQTYLSWQSGESGNPRLTALLSDLIDSRLALESAAQKPTEMKRVNLMKRSLVIFALSAMTTSCVGVVVNTAGSARDTTEAELMQADRDFAVATHARGIDGWMSFYASDAIRIRYRDNMVRGLNEIRQFDLPRISDTTSTLNWEPTDARIFRGGSIGSTTGRYWIVSRTGADAGKELGTGRYVTMWRREGGRWLVIMDTGYPDPPPAR